MKVSKRSNRILGGMLLASCIGIIAVVRVIHTAITQTPRIEIVCDAQLTSHASSMLTSWCQKHPEVAQDPKKLVDEFCWIKSCAVRYTKIGSASIRIVPHTAMAVLNEHSMLMSNGSVAATSYFVHVPCAQLKVNERLFTDQVQRKELVASVNAMAPYLFDHYSFSWRDATTCTILDKVTGHTVLADNQTITDVKKIEIGMGLAGGKCIADIRFDQQVIVAKKRGGDEIISRC